MSDKEDGAFELGEKVVVVTGAGRGLGRAYAMAAATAGATVVVADIDRTTAEEVADTIRSQGGRSLAVAGAVDDPDFGERLATVTIGTFGRIDGFVANAGVMRGASIVDESADNLTRHMTVNVVGLALSALPTIRAMADAGQGAVVLITSGARFGLPGVGAYAASKGAVASLTWAWALELAAHGVRVNALSPIANTEMFSVAEQHYATMAGAGTPATVQASAERPAEPAAITPAVVYLLSDRSSHITGQILRFTGTHLSVYPSPVTRARDVVDTEWTPGKIAAAIEGELLGALADVSFGDDVLHVPLVRSEGER